MTIGFSDTYPVSPPHRDVFLPLRTWTKNFLKAKACNCNVKPKFFGQETEGEGLLKAI